jgi:hypothetical protein
VALADGKQQNSANLVETRTQRRAVSSIMASSQAETNGNLTALILWLALLWAHLGRHREQIFVGYY